MSKIWVTRAELLKMVNEVHEPKLCEQCKMPISVCECAVLERMTVQADGSIIITEKLASKRVKR